MLSIFKGKVANTPPVWLMRQAGRYLPEYMKTREKAGNFLGLVYNPELAAEVTLQPLRRYNFDAAILFSDILTIPQALGQDVSFEASHGPVLGVIPEKISFNEARFHQFLQPVYDAVSTIRAQMSAEGFHKTTLIGFSGAPWTLACYMVERGGSRDFMATRLQALQQPEMFQLLIDVLVESISNYLLRQIEAGAEIIQIFDSWAGALPYEGLEQWVMGPTARIVEAIKQRYPNVPVIGFPKGIGQAITDYVRITGVDGVSIDAATSLDWAVSNIPPHIVIQGNLDPYTLVAGGSALSERVSLIRSSTKGRRHIFNLGHGIEKSTPPENVTDLLRHVRQQ